MIDESGIGRYLERAAHHKRDTGMVADGIEIIEQLIEENVQLRKALDAADELYEEAMEKRDDA